MTIPEDAQPAWAGGDVLSEGRTKAAINLAEGLSAEDRRWGLAAERRARTSGEWGAWEHSEQLAAKPHAADFRNAAFSVRVKDHGTAIRLSVASLSGRRPTWWEMQRIKNDFAGPDATAVEVYPPQSEVVDNADVFHVWIVPRLPFSLYRSDPKRAAGE